MSAADIMNKARVSVHAEIADERKLYMRAAAIANDGTVTLTMSAADWRLFDMKGVDKAAASLNAAIAQEINAGHTGSELMRRCHTILQLLTRFGGGDSEPSWALCKLLVHVKGDDNYHRFARHYSDYGHGWRQLGTVNAEHGFLWIGDPEEAPVAPAPRDAGSLAAPVQVQQYPRGFGVTLTGNWPGTFRVDGLFPVLGGGGRLSEIRVVLSD